MSRRTREQRPDPDQDEGAERESKSAAKRAALAAQELGEGLLRLTDAQRAALALPPELEEALRAAHRISSRAALARQRQYIGKLMRRLDLDAIRAALAQASERAAIEGELNKRIESWRERLIAHGRPALEELARWYPDIELAEWAERVAAARGARARGAGRGGAARELFRALRALFATMPR